MRASRALSLPPSPPPLLPPPQRYTASAKPPQGGVRESRNRRRVTQVTTGHLRHSGNPLTHPCPHPHTQLHPNNRAPTHPHWLPDLMTEERMKARRHLLWANRRYDLIVSTDLDALCPWCGGEVRRDPSARRYRIWCSDKCKRLAYEAWCS